MTRRTPKGAPAEVGVHYVRPCSGLNDGGYEVDVWATDEQEAVRLGAERIERFMAGKGH